MDDVRFARELEECRRMVMTLCTKATRDYERSRDITQSALARAWKSRHTYSGKVKLSTWVGMVAVSTLRDDLRSRKRRITETSPLFGDDGTLVVEFEDETLPSPFEDTLSEELEAALGTLSELARQIVMRRADDELFEDIAGDLGLRWAASSRMSST